MAANSVSASGPANAEGNTAQISATEVSANDAILAKLTAISSRLEDIDTWVRSTESALADRNTDRARASESSDVRQNPTPSARGGLRRPRNDPGPG